MELMSLVATSASTLLLSATTVAEVEATVEVVAVADSAVVAVEAIVAVEVAVALATVEDEEVVEAAEGSPPTVVGSATSRAQRSPSKCRSSCHGKMCKLLEVYLGVVL
jgi:hypothetical protein